jgi:hypothetical protein
MTNNLEKGDSPWEYGLVDTEHGLMLLMKTDMIVPKRFVAVEGYTYYGNNIDPNETKIQEYDSYSEIRSIIRSMHYFVHMPDNHIIDTKNPLGREMLLSPKYNILLTDDSRMSAPEVYVYESMLYAKYNTSSDANISIYIDTSGSNSWKIKLYQSNWYVETIDVQLSGSQDGWVPVSGLLGTGKGVYREPA